MAECLAFKLSFSHLERRSEKKEFKCICKSSQARLDKKFFLCSLQEET